MTLDADITILDTAMQMRRGHRNTLESIFRHPGHSNVPRRHVEALSLTITIHGRLRGRYPPPANSPGAPAFRGS